MTFEMYMAKNFRHFDLAKGEMTINGGWLKGFWLAAQQCMLDSAVEAIRAENPCDLTMLDTSDQEDSRVYADYVMNALPTK